MPLAVSIEPTNTCNLHCPECPAGIHELTRSTGFMTEEIFRKAIDQLYPTLAYLTLYFQGEPYLNKQVFSYIRYARSRGVFVATSTNGHFFNDDSVRQTLDSGLNRLIVSMDGFNQQTYEAYRKGGNFQKVVDGIRLLVNEKKRLKRHNPEIILQCLILSTNEHHLDEIRLLADDLGVDKLTFKTAQFYEYRNGNLLMPENQKFSRYQSKKQHPKSTVENEIADIIPEFRLKNKLRNSCFRMWSSCVITWDGNVVPCCFDKDADFRLGDLKNQSFKKIWRGEAYQKFRGTILRKRKSIDICCNCTQKF
jgi:radical SAM protein with 4Fe4S-binding SPASM domain